MSSWTILRARSDQAASHNLLKQNWNNIGAIDMSKKLVLLSPFRVPSIGCSEVYRSLEGSMYSFDDEHEQHQISHIGQFDISNRWSWGTIQSLIKCWYIGHRVSSPSDTSDIHFSVNNKDKVIFAPFYVHSGIQIPFWTSLVSKIEILPT